MFLRYTVVTLDRETWIKVEPIIDIFYVDDVRKKKDGKDYHRLILDGTIQSIKNHKSLTSHQMIDFL